MVTAVLTQGDSNRKMEVGGRGGGGQIFLKNTPKVPECRFVDVTLIQTVD